MILPDLAGGAGGVADVLVHELVVPRLADAEGRHVADLHVGHHLGRRHDDGRDVLVGIDAARGQPVADPHVVGAAGEGHGALHFLARRLLLGEGFLERRGVGLGAAALEFVGDRDALALVVEPRQDIHRRRLVLRGHGAERDQVGKRRQDMRAVDAARRRAQHHVVARRAPRGLLGDVGVGDAVFVEDLLFLGDDQRRGVGEGDEAQGHLVGLGPRGLREGACRQRRPCGAQQCRRGGGALENVAASESHVLHCCSPEMEISERLQFDPHATPAFVSVDERSSGDGKQRFAVAARRQAIDLGAGDAHLARGGAIESVR